MTTFWLWVGAGCAFSALFGFSAVRFAPRLLKARAVDPASTPVWELPPTPAQEPVAAAATTIREPPPASAAPRRPRAPTAPEPKSKKLALWAHQIKAGERKMSIATDGCRVTWNRTCKHGHPSWLVHLGYLEPAPPPPKRDTPR
jgi:hypothetical protein